MFALVESLFLPSLPWENLRAQIKEGPKNQAMYAVLKAAKAALNSLDPEILNTAKQVHATRYDQVKTRLAGNKSLGNGGYAYFATIMGTVQNQPGYMVDQILLRVDHMLLDLCRKYNAESRPVVEYRPGI